MFSRMSFTKSLLIVFTIHFGAASLAFADYELNKSELLQKIDNGTVSMEKSPVMSLPADLYRITIENQKKEFPGFREEMFYYAYVNSNNMRYMIFFEWYDRGCIFGKTKPMGTDSKLSGKAFYELSKKENESYEKIDKKYCEKLLGLTIHNSGGLPRMNVPRKPPGGKK